MTCSRCGSAEHTARHCPKGQHRDARKSPKLDDVTVPRELRDEMRERAAAEGVSASALWARAARALLGWPEPPKVA